MSLAETVILPAGPPWRETSTVAALRFALPLGPLSIATVPPCALTTPDKLMTALSRLFVAFAFKTILPSWAWMTPLLVIDKLLAVALTVNCTS